MWPANLVEFTESVRLSIAPPRGQLSSAMATRAATAGRKHKSTTPPTGTPTEDHGHKNQGASQHCSRTRTHRDGENHGVTPTHRGTNPVRCATYQVVRRSWTQCRGEQNSTVTKESQGTSGKEKFRNEQSGDNRAQKSQKKNDG